MARDIAMLPNQVLLAPAIEPLLAAFTQFRGNIISFGKNVNFCIFIVGIVSIPISFYIWYFPLPLIGTLLGEQWVNSSNILKSMAFLFLYFNFVLVVEQALIALKRIRLLFFFDLFSLLAVTTVLIISVSSDMPIEEIALVRGLTGVITTCIIFIIMSNLINLNKMRLVCFFVVITLLSAVSVEIVQLFKLTSFNVHLYNLVASGTVFVLCYSSSLLIIFYIFSDLDEIQKLLKLSGKSSCSN
jgi:O-antigen/teichoic acid export membrane protein